VIVVGASATPETVGHESAHFWHSPIHETPHAAAVCSAGERALVAYANEIGWPFEDQRRRDERLADACAYCWLAGAPWR
jgi:hypothetical protein